MKKKKVKNIFNKFLTICCYIKLLAPLLLLLNVILYGYDKYQKSPEYYNTKIKLKKETYIWNCCMNGLRYYAKPLF